MATSVTLPALGESVTEGTVTRWLKQEGDTVEADEPLLEVSTDKVDTEIPSPAAGTLLSIKVQEDETVEVGAELAVIGDSAEGGGDTGGGGDTAGGSDSRSGDGVAEAETPGASAGGDTPSDQTDDTSAEATAGEASPAQPAASDSGSGSAAAGGTSGGSGQSVSVTLPALGESVTEGTVTRWLKQEGDTVEADEPLLEVSTDKVDTEIPSPAAGTLLSIKVQEDETVEVGAELAVIGSGTSSGDTGGTSSGDTGGTSGGDTGGTSDVDDRGVSGGEVAKSSSDETPADEKPAALEEKQYADKQEAQNQASDSSSAPGASGQAQSGSSSGGSAPSPGATSDRPGDGDPTGDRKSATPAASSTPAPSKTPAVSTADSSAGSNGAGTASSSDGAYVTPLVRKLAAEAGIDLGSITGTGVGGRIRKQDVTGAAEAKAAQDRAASEAASKPAAPATSAPAAPAPAASAPAAASGGGESLRGQTVKMTRMRAFIAKRMVESLQISAQLTTVVEVDVTQIARLRKQAQAAFTTREGVKLSFLPFFAKAAIEALRAYPQVNSSINNETNEVTYHGAEHLGVAVDTERGLIVPVIHDAGDLNIGGLARKIADLAERTRSNKISPDELAGGTFTLTNTGSRGALFDTPILNQPQVGILGTGAVVKRPVVIDDPRLGETIVVRSMVYLALTYDHRIVDGADAARFLTSMKQRLEEGKFEADLGL